MALAAVAAPSAAEIVASSENGFVSQNSATVTATPHEVWRALIAPASWWNSDHTYSANAANLSLDATAGGCFCEVLPPQTAGEQAGSVQHAVVVQALPGAALRLRGGLGPLQAEPATGVLTIQLAPVDGGTRISWEYNVGGAMRFPVSVIAPAVDGVMAQQLAGLVSHLETAGLGTGQRPL